MHISLTIAFVLFASADAVNISRNKRQLTLTCSDGTRAVSACFSGNTCGLGYRCDTTLRYCCVQTAITSMPLCPDGRASFAGCRNGVCGRGLTCQGQNLCCGTPTVVTTTCPSGAAPIGTCINGACGGTGFTCVNNNCCSNTACPSGNTPTGNCINGACGTGLACINNNCCS